ncbi:MAG: rod shape-determining protein MreC [Chloroflexi bacterium]|nr:rod shape-determining protein MreC [Chloroflexota bacterium]
MATTPALQNRAARRTGIAFVVLLVLSALLMAFSGNPVLRDAQNGVGFAFRPIQAALDSVASEIASIGTAIGEIDQLRTDNEALRAENARLDAENSGTAEIRRENELLTGLLQLRAGFDYQTAAASVIARESSEFRRTVTLDKGSDAGIEVGDVVVASGGALAGRVTAVGPQSAMVVLLTDGESTVIGQLPSAATGEVEGHLATTLPMTQIDSSAAVSLGDEVVTAGIELGSGVRSPYPKGLVIGQVVDVKRDANDVVQTAFLQPAADLDRLEFVLVILDYKGGLPPIDEQPVDCPKDGTLPEGEQPCFASPPPSPKPSVTPKP